jgi:hypothetical protein
MPMLAVDTSIATQSFDVAAISPATSRHSSGARSGWTGWVRYSATAVDTAIASIHGGTSQPRNAQIDVGASVRTNAMMIAGESAIEARCANAAIEMARNAIVEYAGIHHG